MFSLSSKIIDFIVTETETECQPDSLIILSEEEIVLVDLLTPGWPQYRPPYLLSLHASAITCLSLHSELPEDLLTELELLASTKTEHKYSARAWPVQGGESEGEQNVIIGSMDVEALYPSIEVNMSARIVGEMVSESVVRVENVEWAGTHF